MKVLSKLLVIATASVVLSGCTGMYTKNGTPNDPWQGFNRGVFAFNDTLDHYALRPIAQGYQDVTPHPVREGVGNFFNNLSDVGNTVNGVLQGNPAIAGTSFLRLLINSTLGVGGVLDPAGDMGIHQRSEDMGKTLAAWGFKSGPFLMLPLLGPSDLRDTAGLPVDWYTNVATYINNNYAKWGLYFVNLVNIRASLLANDNLVNGDRYIFIRDAWMQHRQFEIDGGKITQDPFAAGAGDFDTGDPASGSASSTGTQGNTPSTGQTSK